MDSEPDNEFHERQGSHGAVYKIVIIVTKLSDFLRAQRKDHYRPIRFQWFTMSRTWQSRLRLSNQGK